MNTLLALIFVVWGAVLWYQSELTPLLAILLSAAAVVVWELWAIIDATMAVSTQLARLYAEQPDVKAQRRQREADDEIAMYAEVAKHIQSKHQDTGATKPPT